MSLKSMKPVSPFVCVICNREFVSKLPSRRTTCSPECLHRLRQLRNAMNDPDAREKVRQSKLGSKNPNWKPPGRTCVVCGEFFIKKERRTPTCSKECGAIYHGQHNGMKNPGVAQKVADAVRIRRLAGEIQPFFLQTDEGRKRITEIARIRASGPDNPMLDPSISRLVALKGGATTRKQFANGRQVTTYRYQEYKKKDGNIVKLQSSYEVAYARYLDDSQIAWLCHHEKGMPHLGYEIDGIQRTYFPDFYLPDSNILIDTKSTYICNMPKERRKLAAIYRDNPHVTLVILNEFDLRDLGIDIGWVPKNVKDYKDQAKTT